MSSFVKSHAAVIVDITSYFGRSSDSALEARQTALWLRERMEARDDVFLLGKYPGFTRAKSRAIHEILEPRHWKRLALAHFEQGWLVSHAGFHPVWMEEPTVEKILARCRKAKRLAAKRSIDPILGAGQDRGGMQRFGGPLWMDFDSLYPIPNINQIVGHTPGREVRERITPESRNYCLDVNNASVAAILCDGELTILQQ